MALKRNLLRIGLNFLYIKIFQPIEIVCAYLMFLSVFFTVLLREVFRIGIIWGYEIASFWAIILVFLATPHNLHLNADLRVGIIYDSLKGIHAKIMRVFHYLCFTFVIYALAIGFYQYMKAVSHVPQPATRFPNWLFFGVVGIGIGFSILELIAQIIDLFTEPSENEQALTDRDEARKAVEEGGLV